MDPSRGDSRYNLNYSMSSIGLTLADQSDMYGNPATVAALGGRPPSAGILQGMSVVGGAPGSGLLSRSSGSLMSNTQCQSLGNSSSGHSNSQQRGLKRAGSDCYDDSHHRVGGGNITTLQGLDNCGSTANVHSNQQQPQSSSGVVQDIVDDSYTNLQSKKSPPANGKKTKGRVKIKMEYIDNKLRRYTTFSKRKTGIMKKAYELSTLTGTQVMLLVASETGHVYTFATRKLQPMITSEAGKQLIQTCLNSPDPPSVGGGDQRMSATGFEETELSYNIADEDSKEVRSPISSMNDSDESSDFDGTGFNLNPNSFDAAAAEISTDIQLNIVENVYKDKEESFVKKQPNKDVERDVNLNAKAPNLHENSCVEISNVPQNVLLQLIEAGHLKVHTEEDGSGHQYVAIPIHTSTVDRKHCGSSSENGSHGLQKHMSSNLIKKEK
ncbi:serum response factor blistered isoform 2-T4 [Cochliomyia hominivorax]